MSVRVSDYIDVKRIEFFVTYQCTGKCRHCFVDESLKCSGNPAYLLPDKAVEVIKTLSDLYQITSVMTFGGEPLLYPDTVCAIHASAMECGIEERQLITNGCFSREAIKRKEVARRLMLSGINDLLLSVDAFHQESIPCDTVYAFAKDLIEEGFRNIRLHPAWVVDEAHDNPYNLVTREMLARFSDLGIAISEGNDIVMTGRAVESLKEYYDEPCLNPEDCCGTMPYTEPLTAVTSITVVPNGDVMICGFVIGNIYAENIVSILSRYNPYQNGCMHAIIKDGVPGLLAYAQSLGIKIELSQCYSICDVCHAVARQLRK